VNDNYAAILRYVLNPVGWLKLDSVRRVLAKFGLSQKLTTDSKIRRGAAEFKRKYTQHLKQNQKKSTILSTSWRIRPHESFNRFLFRAFWPQVFRCALFIFSGYWLTKHEQESWKRDCGFVIALISNIYEAIESDGFNFGIYLNLTTLSIYLAAKYLKNITLEESMDNGADQDEANSLLLLLEDDEDDDAAAQTPQTPLSAGTISTSLRRTWSSHFQATSNMNLRAKSATHYRVPYHYYR